MKDMLTQLMERPEVKADPNEDRKRAMRVRLMAALVEKVGLDELERRDQSLTGHLPRKRG